MPEPWLAERRPSEWSSGSVRVTNHAERVVDAMAHNFAGLAEADAHEYVARRDDPSKWPDALLIPLGHTRKEAVACARELRRVLAPAYALIAARATANEVSAPPVAPRRAGGRARGAGRPAARRTRSAASSSAGSGDDGSGSADPAPPSDRPPPARLSGTSSWADAPTREAGR